MFFICFRFTQKKLYLAYSLFFELWGLSLSRHCKCLYNSILKLSYWKQTTQHFFYSNPKHSQKIENQNNHNKIARRLVDSDLSCKYLWLPDWNRTPNDYDFKDDDDSTTNNAATRPTRGRKMTHTGKEKAHWQGGASPQWRRATHYWAEHTGDAWPT